MDISLMLTLVLVAVISAAVTYQFSKQGSEGSASHIPPPPPIIDFENTQAQIKDLKKQISTALSDKDKILQREIELIKGHEEIKSRLEECLSTHSRPQSANHIISVLDSFRIKTWEQGLELPSDVEWHKSPEAELVENFAGSIFHCQKPLNNSNLLFTTQMRPFNTNAVDDYILICSPTDLESDKQAFISINYDKSATANLRSRRDGNIFKIIRESIESSACEISNPQGSKLIWVKPGMIEKIDADTWRIVEPIILTYY